MTSMQEIHKRRIAVALIIGIALLVVATIAPIPWTILKILIGCFGGLFIAGAFFDNKDYRRLYERRGDPYRVAAEN